MYELLYIVPAPFTEKDLPDISKKVKQIIEKLGGKITKERDLGNRKLAYPIKQVYRGFYLLLNFEIETKKLKELDRKLKLIPEILRHIVVKTIKKEPIRKQARLVKEDEMPKKIIEKKESEPKKAKKIDLKKLGERIDDLFKI